MMAQQLPHRHHRQAQLAALSVVIDDGYPGVFVPRPPRRLPLVDIERALERDGDTLAPYVRERVDQRRAMILKLLNERDSR
jgi:hypothetical protein